MRQELATLLAGDPCAGRRLIDRHVADANGRCVACRASAGYAPPWPCTLRLAADRWLGRWRVAVPLA